MVRPAEHVLRASGQSSERAGAARRALGPDPMHPAVAADAVEPVVAQPVAEPIVAPVAERTAQPVAESAPEVPVTLTPAIATTSTTSIPVVTIDEQGAPRLLTRRELRLLRERAEADAAGQPASGAPAAAVTPGGAGPASPAVASAAPAVVEPAAEVPALVASVLAAPQAADRGPAEVVSPESVELAAPVVATSLWTAPSAVQPAEPLLPTASEQPAEPEANSLAQGEQPVSPEPAEAASRPPRDAVLDPTPTPAYTPARLAAVRPTGPVRLAASAGTHPRGRSKLRERLVGVSAMLAVGAIFATITLPSYAWAQGESGSSLVSASQSLQANGVANILLTRDGYGTTTIAALKATYANAIKAKTLEAYVSADAHSLVDDYPWSGVSGWYAGLSPLGYYYRQCVDFVAWRLNRDAGSTSSPFKYTWSNLTPGGGDAADWKSAWKQHGWTVSDTPIPGSVAWFPGGDHVAYVNSVLPGDMVLIEEYNWGGSRAYDQRIIDESDAQYLYPPGS